MLRSLLVPVFAAVVLVLSASCTAGSAAGEAGPMVAVLSNIDAVGFHSIDESLNLKSEGKIDAQWGGKVRHAQIAVASTGWPKDLDKLAKDFVSATQQLAVAVEADDPKAAAPAAKAAHEAQHELSTDGWAFLGKRAGLAAGGHDEAPSAATAPTKN